MIENYLIKLLGVPTYKYIVLFLTALFMIASGCDALDNWSDKIIHITFGSDRDGNSEIYVMNCDGSNQTRLTYNSATDIFPVWTSIGIISN